MVLHVQWQIATWLSISRELLLPVYPLVVVEGGVPVVDTGHHWVAFVVVSDCWAKRLRFLGFLLVRISLFLLFLLRHILSSFAPDILRVRKHITLMVFRVRELFEFVEPPFRVSPFLSDLCEVQNSNFFFMEQI